MYTKDLVKRVTLRLDDQLAQFIAESSEMTGQTPSEWVRMVLHSYMSTVKAAMASTDALLQPLTRTGKAVTNEDQKTR